MSESHSAVVETMSTAEVIVVLSATLAVETAPPPTSQPPVTADQASSVTTTDKAAMATQGIQLNLPPGRLPMPLAFGTSEDYLNEFVSAAPLEGNRGDQ